MTSFPLTLGAAGAGEPGAPSASVEREAAARAVREATAARAACEEELEKARGASEARRVRRNGHIGDEFFIPRALVDPDLVARLSRKNWLRWLGFISEHLG